MDGIPKIGQLANPGKAEVGGAARGADAAGFTDALKDAIQAVDDLQRDSEAAQTTYAEGGAIDLHDVLIRIEEAELAFKTMMEVRNKLVDAYHEVMRIGG